MMFNSLFDIMKLRKLNASGYKSPILKEYSDKVQDFLVIAEMHIRSLKLPDGVEILRSN